MKAGKRPRKENCHLIAIMWVTIQNGGIEDMRRFTSRSACTETLNLTYRDFVRVIRSSIRPKRKEMIHMNREALVREVSSASKAKRLAKEISIIAAFVALMAICSWIKVPGAVPVTLQTFAIFLAIGILGTKRGTAAVASFVAIGMMGAPVFASFAGGPAYLLGTSGGYIMGFVATAAVTGIIMDKLGRSVASMAFAMVVGLAVCYAFGTIWFMSVYGASTGMSIEYVLSVCVVPFIVPDIIKIALAITASKLVKR